MSKRRGTRVLTGAGVSLGAVFGIPASAQAVDITVSNLSDHDSGSLRNAIAAANTPAGGHIVFQSGLTGTITLTTGEISLGGGFPAAGPINIDGPGAGVITVSGNNASRIFNSFGTPPPDNNLLTISGLTLTGGNSATNGGAILNGFGMNLTVANSTITDNSAGSGGGIASFGAGTRGTTTILNSTITGNHATDATASPNNGGGGLLEYGSITSIQNTTISGNTSARNGGGIHARAHDPGSTYFPTINGSTISGNTATNRGGGLYGYNARATITNTTISGNMAVNGSGMAMMKGRSFISDTTISGNTGASYGGGVWADGASAALTSLSFQDSTIANNSASVGGGGITAGNHVTDPSLSSTIVADNTAAFGPDIRDAAGDNFNADFSLIENASGATVIGATTGSNLLGIDPQLGALGPNGGPTQTQRPGVTSPVLDQGKAAAALDQRGVARPFDIPSLANSAAVGADAADIGAVELTLAEATPPVTPPVLTPAPPAAAASTGQRAAALAKCKKKKGAARKKCKKKANKLPV